MNPDFISQFRNLPPPTPNSLTQDGAQLRCTLTDNRLEMGPKQQSVLTWGFNQVKRFTGLTYDSLQGQEKKELNHAKEMFNKSIASRTASFAPPPLFLPDVVTYYNTRQHLNSHQQALGLDEPAKTRLQNMLNSSEALLQDENLVFSSFKPAPLFENLLTYIFDNTLPSEFSLLELETHLKNSGKYKALAKEKKDEVYKIFEHIKKIRPIINDIINSQHNGHNLEETVSEKFASHPALKNMNSAFINNFIGKQIKNRLKRQAPDSPLFNSDEEPRGKKRKASSEACCSIPLKQDHKTLSLFSLFSKETRFSTKAGIENKFESGSESSSSGVESGDNITEVENDLVDIDTSTEGGQAVSTVVGVTGDTTLEPITIDDTALEPITIDDSEQEPITIDDSIDNSVQEPTRSEQDPIIIEATALERPA